jgi:hypothetical protein
MNDFSFLTDDVIGKLATIGLEEIFEKTVDGEHGLKETTDMNKEQFKAKQREARLARTDNFGIRMANLLLGKAVSTFDNSHIWAMRDSIAEEIAPIIRKRQLAWING